MKPRTKRALGIDIGAHHIRAALVEKSAQGLRVIAAASGEVPDVQPQPGGPLPAKTLVRVLRKVARRTGSRDVETAVAVSTPSMVMRLLDLPPQMPANVRELVDNELAQCVALSGRKRRSDFCAVNPGSSPRKRLLTVAADTDQLGDVVKTCIAAGIRVDAVEPSSLAYVRAFIVGERALRHTDNVMLAVLSTHNLMVYLFRHGTLDFIRVRDLPSGMEGAGLPCDWLTEEMETVVRYCRAGAPGTGATWRVRLLLHDVAYRKDDIASRLAVKAAGQPVEVVEACEPLTHLPGNERGAAAQPPSAVAVGAAMKLLEPEGDELRIDLTPPEVVQTRLSSRRMLIVANAAAAALLAILLITEILTQTTGAMDRQIEQTRLAERVPMMPALVEGDRHLDRQIEQVQGQLAHLQAVRARRELDWPAVLDSIWQAKPAAVSVTYFACDDNRAVLLKGIAASPAQARAFVQSLDRQALLASAWMKRIERAQPDDGAFEFEIHGVMRTTD